MNFGFNSNVVVGSISYHVQTEDRGPAHPFLDTVVYLAGRVVYKRSTSYKDFASAWKPDIQAQMLQGLLSQQHREVIEELEGGTLPITSETKGSPSHGEKGSDYGLELQVMNPKNWFAAGNVVLELELVDKKSKQRVSNADIQANLESGEQRIPCVAARTDEKGRVRLKFPFPPSASDGAALVVSAHDASRYAELRFQLKAKPRGKSPAPVAR
jgi:hypothetical protein